MYEVCGKKELKVILALDSGDSISGVARKIEENRGDDSACREPA